MSDIKIENSKASFLPKRWVGLVPSLAGLIAFLIYALLAYELHPAQDHAFIPERSSLAAAASNAIYGAPLGKVYSGVLQRFFEETSSTEKVLSEAAQKQLPLGELQSNTRDGNGIGYMLVADAAFRLFGVHAASPVAMMLLLMVISTVSFLYRFRDRRAAVVALYFTALTIMLFGPLTGLDDLVIQTPIGGIRYFSLAGILPAFHLMLELADPEGSGSRMSFRILIPLAVQVVVLLVAILVRNSAATLIGALAIGTFLSLRKVRTDEVAKGWTLRKGGAMALVGAAFIGLLLLSFSRGYVAEGRFTETVWHRIFVSLGMHPKWPYGNLWEVYDCRKSIPEGLVNGPEDRNGHCIFIVDVNRRGISPDEAGGTYGRQYDAALRKAFFYILRRYPEEVLNTFLVIKVQRIAWSVSEGAKFYLNAIPAGLRWLLLAAIVNLLVCAIAASSSAAPRSHLSMGGATMLFGAFSILPFLAVWAHPQTAADLYAFCWIALGLALMAGIRQIRQASQRSLA